ncbi:acid sugar phosphatase [Leptolinea sp. HRD-7]|nr:acid sugar phosphatase [Leptolinea sp. HRD-7]
MKYKACIFDQDGTIYLGNSLISGAAETIARLRAAGSRTIFLSNNPTKTREQYAEKLARLGIPTNVDDIVNSSYVMVEWLKENTPGACLYVIGEESIIGELKEAGFVLSEKPGEVDVVVASFDRTFDYHKLQVAFDAINAGARLVATNPDRYCPTPTGGEPDCAAIIAALEACTGVKCDPVVGKPSPIMVRTIMEKLGLLPKDCLMVGDRLETDIRMGIEAGMDTCLVLTGDADREKLKISGLKPTMVLNSIAGLLEMCNLSGS